MASDSHWNFVNRLLTGGTVSTFRHILYGEAGALSRRRAQGRDIPA
ncbi:hypothetical protein HMPREF1546_02104 [Oscillibacter sp. KLE 1745]|nr:hypothetical protein HMPREF1546_02104 [Oscillibacter sp. KLE 1745]